MSLYFPTADEYARHTPFPGVRIATCAAEKMMLSYVEIEPGAIVSEHHHPHEQVGLILEGKALFTIGGEQKLLKKGDMFRIPGNVKHRVEAMEEGLKALDIFHPIRDDYR